MTLELRAATVVALMLLAPSTGAGAAETFGITVTSNPSGVIGERRTTATIKQLGTDPAAAKFYVKYATTQSGVDARPATYGIARCSSPDSSTRSCTMIFPHPDRPTPNALDSSAGSSAKGLIVEPGKTVYFRWCKDIQASQESSELLSLCAPVQSFVMPRPYTIVLLGESFAAGEGAPYGSDLFAPNKWVYQPCHRSMQSGFRRAVVDFRNANPGIQIDSNHLACSGATIDEGLLGEQSETCATTWPLSPAPEWKYPPQLALARDWMLERGHPRIDAVFVSVGGNDMGFGQIVENCLVGNLEGCHKSEATKELIANGLDGLLRSTAAGTWTGAYAELDTYFRDNLRAGRVFITEYPDPTRGTDGAFCDPDTKQFECFGPLEDSLHKVEAEFAYHQALVPLNRKVKQAASAFGWTLLGDSAVNSDGSLGNKTGHMARSRTKGLCACEDGFYNTVKTSLARQLDVCGAAHMWRPNGQDPIYRASVRAALDQYVAPPSLRRATVLAAPIAPLEPSRTLTRGEGTDPSEAASAWEIRETELTEPVVARGEPPKNELAERYAKGDRSVVPPPRPPREPRDLSGMPPSVAERIQKRHELLRKAYEELQPRR